VIFGGPLPFSTSSPTQLPHSCRTEVRSAKPSTDPGPYIRWVRPYVTRGLAGLILGRPESLLQPRMIMEANTAPTSWPSQAYSTAATSVPLHTNISNSTNVAQSDRGQASTWNPVRSLTARCIRLLANALFLSRLYNLSVVA